MDVVVFVVSSIGVQTVGEQCSAHCSWRSRVGFFACPQWGMQSAVRISDVAAALASLLFRHCPHGGCCSVVVEVVVVVVTSISFDTFFGLGTLIVRIGFWGPVHNNYTKEPPPPYIYIYIYIYTREPPI